MFKKGKYYKVTHIKEGIRANCIIKTIEFVEKDNISNIWNVKIIKAQEDSIYNEGEIAHWYEDWCTNVRELKDYEVLAIKL